MSSPTPSEKKPSGEHVEHAYQSSESITCTCSCSCGDKLEGAKGVQEMVVHMPTPLPLTTTPTTTTTCTCHLVGDQEDAHRANSEAGRKVDDDRIEISPLPPALPPRPPPRPRFDGSLGSRYRERPSSPGSSRIRKYVFWCCACGGLATILGALFLAVYFLLRSYTSTLGYFESIPTFVPAAMLILTGVCVMSLARRKNRYSYLLKVCGVCCLVCALTCVLVTITTTVIHMNRLQTLRECVYTQKTRTCTCYSVLLEAHPQADEGMRFVFDSTPDCEVIHGALYTCLRAMFGLSVSGILVCIFSCMLVYQLLSHERKKMYWEQLELRCRSFYQQQQQQQPPASTPSTLRGPPMPPATYCSCCEECRYPQIVPTPQLYPWDAGERFWTPGRVGNFYSPNPGEELTQNDNRIATSGWNWRRLPWSRSASNDSRDNSSLTYQGIASSTADSQYGFTHRHDEHSEAPPPPPNPPVSSTDSYSVLDTRPAPLGGVYVWGPPPPYSNPNSPARRTNLAQSPARFFHHHHHQQQQQQMHALHHHHHHHHQHQHENHCQMNDESLRHLQELRMERRPRHKDNYENTVGEVVEYHHAHNDAHDHTDTSSNGERVVHSMPVRKVKKRVDLCVTSACTTSPGEELSGQTELSKPEDGCRFLPRLQGVENAAFQQQETSPQKPPQQQQQQQQQEPSESEVYFADVSSCCNISVRNDGPDSSLYDEAIEAKKMLNRRLPLPLPNEAMCVLPTDASCSSLASSAQTPLTETTDDCTTPTDSFLAPDAQYEVIPEGATVSGYRSTASGSGSNLAATISGCLTQPFVRRAVVGSNISNLIKNLGSNPVGLLYNDAGEEEVEGRGHSHSDATIDSGWQSGASDKLEQLDVQTPVNV